MTADSDSTKNDLGGVPQTSSLSDPVPDTHSSCESKTAPNSPQAFALSEGTLISEDGKEVSQDRAGEQPLPPPSLMTLIAASLKEIGGGPTAGAPSLEEPSNKREAGSAQSQSASPPPCASSTAASATTGKRIKMSCATQTQVPLETLDGRSADRSAAGSQGSCAGSTNTVKLSADSQQAILQDVMARLAFIQHRDPTKLILALPNPFWIFCTTVAAHKDLTKLRHLMGLAVEYREHLPASLPIERLVPVRVSYVLAHMIAELVPKVPSIGQTFVALEVTHTVARRGETLADMVDEVDEIIQAAVMKSMEQMTSWSSDVLKTVGGQLGVAMGDHPPSAITPAYFLSDLVIYLGFKGWVRGASPPTTSNEDWGDSRAVVIEPKSTYLAGSG